MPPPRRAERGADRDTQTCARRGGSKSKFVDASSRERRYEFRCDCTREGVCELERTDNRNPKEEVVQAPARMGYPGGTQRDSKAHFETAPGVEPVEAQ